MKKTTPRLALRPETIRALSDLRLARGGDGVPVAANLHGGGSGDVQCPAAANLQARDSGDVQCPLR
jgi:hypothetical protein